MELRDYLLTSSKTRSAKRCLESIDSANLKNFLKKEFNRQVKTVSDVNSVFTFIGNAEIYVENFAENLNEPKKMKLFVEAIKDQAKSKGTKPGGLFYRYIYNLFKDLSKEEDIKKFFAKKENRNNIEKNLKIFLLAKKDKDPTIYDAELKEEHRMKKASVIQKLQSKRMSNVLKVFMALTLWKYLQKSSNLFQSSTDDLVKRPLGLSYSPKIFTQVEKYAILYFSHNRASKRTISHWKTWADIPLSYLDVRFFEPSSTLTYVLNFNNPVNKSNNDINEFISKVSTVNQYITKHQLDVVRMEPLAEDKSKEKSVIKLLYDSDEYKSLSQENANNLRIPPINANLNDCKLILFTLTKSIPKTIEEEFRNRIAHLTPKELIIPQVSKEPEPEPITPINSGNSTKRYVSRDDIDFLRMKRKMENFSRDGDFKKGGELLGYYSNQGDGLINGVARKQFNLVTQFKEGEEEITSKNLRERSKVDVGKIIPEDLYLKSLSELSEFRNMGKMQVKKGETLDKKLWADRRNSGSEEFKLFRAVPMWAFMNTIVAPENQKPKKTWLTNNETKNTLLTDCEDVIDYLKGKISRDPAVLSASLTKTIARFGVDGSGIVPAFLTIDVKNYTGTINIRDYSEMAGEDEISFPPGTTLRIDDALYNDALGRFDIYATPIQTGTFYNQDS